MINKKLVGDSYRFSVIRRVGVGAGRGLRCLSRILVGMQILEALCHQVGH